MKPFLSIALSAVALSGAFLDDGAITGRIESGLLDGEGIWTADIIHVETVRGVVHLSGDAATERNRRRAGDIAQSVAGVTKVENDIRVR